MLAASFPLHREHITMFLLTLPHQEVSIILEQLLDLQPGNGTMVPVLLPQRTIHLLHRAEDWYLRAGRENSWIFKSDMNNETIKSDRSWVLGGFCRDYVEILQRRGCNTLKSKCTTLHASRIQQSWEMEGEVVHTSNNIHFKSNTLSTLKYYFRIYQIKNWMTDCTLGLFLLRQPGHSFLCVLSSVSNDKMMKC